MFRPINKLNPRPGPHQNCVIRQALGKDEKGATAIEYGLIAAFIALSIVAAVTNLGSKNQKSFSTTSTYLTK